MITVLGMLRTSARMMPINGQNHDLLVTDESVAEKQSK